jgi:hypothetical protein
MKEAAEPLRRSDRASAKLALARLGTLDDHVTMLEAGPDERLAMIVAAQYPEGDGELRKRAAGMKESDARSILMGRASDDAAALRPKLDSLRPNVQRAALAGLIRLGDKTAFARAQILFDDGKLPVSPRQIARLDPARAESWLIGLTRSSDPVVRAEAAMALVTSKEGAALVTRMARTEPWTITREGETILDAYVQLKGADAEPLLLELFERGVLPVSAQRHLVGIDEVVAKIFEGRLDGNLTLLESVVNRTFSARHAAPVEWDGATAGGVKIVTDAGARLPPRGKYASLESLLQETGGTYWSDGDAVRVGTPEAARAVWTAWWEKRGRTYP